MCPVLFCELELIALFTEISLTFHFLDENSFLTIFVFEFDSNTSNFTSYTNRSFTDDDLERLANLAEKLDSMGCKVLLSNSKSKIVENSFSSSKWKIKEIRVNRAINSNSKKRTGHSEILVKNY